LTLFSAAVASMRPRSQFLRAERSSKDMSV
jgi:hypothetical protein